MRRSFIAISLGLSLIASTALSRDGRAASAVPALPDLTAFVLMRLTAGAPAAPVSVEQAADALKDYDVIFLGEWHDHSGNHLAEMALFRALYARAPNLALSMEMFERDVQPVVDDYMAGRIGEDNFRRRGRAWGNYAESYRPLVEFAKDHGLPLIAANAPASVVRCVGQEGPDFLAHMPADKRGWAAAELHLSDGPYKEKFLRFLAEDGAHGEDANRTEDEKKQAADRSFASQVTRDDTMAESIVLSARKNPGRKIVHVTGAFHVESALGTVERLRLRAPDLKIALVVPVEAEHPETPSLKPGDAAAANFAFLLKASPPDYVSDAEKKEAESRMQGNFRTQSRCTL
ncbi:MAG TPA: ChaN family lipoprotein [Micropepsaceae bacterium]|nr:ChaN family lipoprotein [Micropepsaceae bacterium]